MARPRPFWWLSQFRNSLLRSGIRLARQALIGARSPVTSRRHQTAASPVSRSVPGFKRDDDVRCFRLVKLEASRVVVAPAGKIHDLGRLSRRPGGGLGLLHDIEPIAVEEERVFPEQVVELWNHGVVV